MVSTIQAACQAAWKLRAACEYKAELQESYLKQCGLAAREWEAIRDRLFFVNQSTSASETFEQLEEFADEFETSYDDLLSMTSSISNELVGEQAFDEVLARLKLTDYFLRQGRLDQPIPTAIHLILTDNDS